MDFPTVRRGCAMLATKGRLQPRQFVLAKRTMSMSRTILLIVSLMLAATTLSGRVYDPGWHHDRDRGWRGHDWDRR